MKNWDPYFLNLLEFIEAVPTERGKKIDWEEFKAKKEAAELALRSLERIIKDVETKNNP